MSIENWEMEEQMTFIRIGMILLKYSRQTKLIRVDRRLSL